MGLRVRAKVNGVYGHLREVGDVFEIADEKAFSKRWMERVGDDDVAPAPPRKRRDGPTPEQVAAEEAAALEREVKTPPKPDADADEDDTVDGDADDEAAAPVARRSRRR